MIFRTHHYFFRIYYSNLMKTMNYIMELFMLNNQKLMKVLKNI